MIGKGYKNRLSHDGGCLNKNVLLTRIRIGIWWICTVLDTEFVYPCPRSILNLIRRCIPYKSAVGLKFRAILAYLEMLPPVELL